MDDVVLEASEGETRQYKSEKNHSYYIQAQEGRQVREEPDSFFLWGASMELPPWSAAVVPIEPW